jgi:hypothetical protein
MKEETVICASYCLNNAGFITYWNTIKYTYSRSALCTKADNHCPLSYSIYSVLRLLTGLAFAALKVRIPIVAADNEDPPVNRSPEYKIIQPGMHGPPGERRGNDKCQDDEFDEIGRE